MNEEQGKLIEMGLELLFTTAILASSNERTVQDVEKRAQFAVQRFIVRHHHTIVALLDKKAGK